MSEASASRDERITAATLELLRSKGPRAVTVEAVSARSGVAKTTIYRRYRDRNEVLTAAMSSVARPAPPDDTSSLLPILEWVVAQSRHAIDGGIGVGGLAALLTDEDPEFTELMRQLLAQHRRNLADVLKSAMRTHDLRADIDVETVLDAIVGAYMSERARSGGVRRMWSRVVLRNLWPALTTQSLPAELAGKD
ncbi:MAG: TetR/AcrR family transcriptional regulator [Aldersonia sp.]|nr:TetR/AcrR family transcriptional regulator [Aldersonia sp.]